MKFMPNRHFFGGLPFEAQGKQVQPSRGRNRFSSEAGFTLIMVVFLVASMILFAAMAVPVVLTEGRREMEKETIWRGEQYQRAIGLYYRKFQRPPTKIEDLTRQTNGVRFLRQAYTDPMNKEDGSWRFIYLAGQGANAQLVGSVRYTSLMQHALAVSSSMGVGGTSPFGVGAALQSVSAPGGAAGPGAVAPGQQTNSPANLSPSDSQPQPLGGPVIGGNIIGVGGKVKMPSFRLYYGGDTYEKWEFIFDPMLQARNPNAPALPGGAQPSPNQGQFTPGTTPTPPGPPPPTQ